MMYRLATMHARRHRRTDGQTDDSMMPITDQTARQYDRLKIG